ncbi:MAG: dienelactone hydrolase family protein [Candidatus Eremiobacteraeota bacterium]|nr:dienelactone hydrolase family protein [Candidatus Eremiobacteraeota bacterium]
MKSNKTKVLLVLAICLVVAVVSIFFLTNSVNGQTDYSRITHQDFNFQFNGKTIRGVAAFPDQMKRFPGILVLNPVGMGTIDNFARKGFFAVRIDFRDEKDCKEAIKQIRLHNRCTGKAGVTGFSFGGALSMVIAAKNHNVHAVVEAAGLLHPMNNIDLSKDMYAAVLFISGENDNAVSPDATRKMYEDLKKGGRPAEIYIVPGQGHGFSHEYNEIVFKKSVDFFRKHLR